MAYVIGVDAGGTATTAGAYGTEDGRSLAFGEAGFGNVVVDYAKAMEHICQAVDRVLQKDSAPELIFVGAAGAMTGGLTGKMEEALGLRYRCPVKATSDAMLALEGALAGKDGVLLIAGTGSAVQVRKGEESLLIGGWGDKVGDEGSAYAMACDALRLMTKACDRGEPEHPLSAAIRQVYHTANARDTVRYISGCKKGEIAMASVAVNQMAEQGDREALDIIRRAGCDLADFVETAACRLELPSGFPLAFQGGVLKKCVLLREALMDSLRARGISCQVQPFTSELTRGAFYVYRAEKEKKEHEKAGF